MLAVVELAARLIALGGHGHIFSSALQLHQWVTALEQKTEDVVVDDSRRGGDTVENTIWSLKQIKPSGVPKTPGMYYYDTRTYRLHHMTVYEIAVHF